MRWQVFWLIFLTSCSSAVTYKILVLDPMMGQSHFNLGKAASETLQKRGHEVTFINGFPSNKSIYRDIGVTTFSKFKGNNSPHLAFDTSEEWKIKRIIFLGSMVPKMISLGLSSEGIQAVLNDKHEKFDLVIIVHFFNEALIGFGVKYDCPVIMISPVPMMHWLARDTGNPISPATVPNVFLSYTKDMTFKERLVNTAMDLAQEFVGWVLLHRKQEALYKELLPEEAARVPYSDLKKKIAMVFMNSHPSRGVARPLLPNTVEVNGFHVGEVEPLPEKYQKILDNAKDGAVLFSMGSNLKSVNMPVAVREQVLRALGKLKQVVLWKFEDDLPEKPDNVIISSWMPQTSILAHPNVKVFISHGGMMSTTEATSAGVPLLVIPIFGDQHYNAKSAQEQGNGLMVEFGNLTEVSLSWAVNELISNSIYNQRAKEIQRLFHDRPMSPRDSIAFYVEHVIRTNGAQHLSAPDLGLFSSMLFDVILVIVVPPFLLLLGIVYICRKCFKSVAAKPNKMNLNTKEKKQ